MEPSTRDISTTRPRGLSAEELILFERLLNFLDSQHAPRRVILSLMKTTAELVQKSRRRMSSIFFKVESARVFLDYWQDNSAAQSLRQQQIMYSQRHGGQARALAVLESHTKIGGMPMGMSEHHKIAMRTYKGIKKLDNETNGWSRKIVNYVETQASNPGLGSDHDGEEGDHQHGIADISTSDTATPRRMTDEDFQLLLTKERVQTHNIRGSIRSEVLQEVEETRGHIELGALRVEVGFRV